VTEQFNAVGITTRGFNTDAFLNEVTLIFVPEPGLPALAGKMSFWRLRLDGGCVRHPRRP
jgi:hypothetical protein